MILLCTSPPNAIYANMKTRKLGVAAGINDQIGPTVLDGDK